MYLTNIAVAVVASSRFAPIHIKFKFAINEKEVRSILRSRFYALWQPVLYYLRRFLGLCLPVSTIGRDRRSILPFSEKEIDSRIVTAIVKVTTNTGMQYGVHLFAPYSVHC